MKYYRNRRKPRLISFPTVDQRFRSKVKVSEDGCWIWQAATTEAGYGRFSLNGKTQEAHRASYELFRGPIPPGMMVRHKVCNNPLCVNPFHLELGTQKENMEDMIELDRQAKGESHGLSELTEANVLEIRGLSADGLSQQIIADMFGISRSQVSKIVNRKNWRHI